jgi:uncharacterized protein YndB with AHSA1/START domain
VDPPIQSTRTACVVMVINASVNFVTRQSTQHLELRLHSTAPAERLFALLSDAPGWPQWFPAARRAEWETGTPDRVRLVGVGRFVVREVVLAETSPHHHAYSIRSVIPVREHRADVRFSPTATGTQIVWTTTFRPVIPGTGALLRHGLRFGVQRLARALIGAAERA